MKLVKIFTFILLMVLLIESYSIAIKRRKNATQEKELLCKNVIYILKENGGKETKFVVPINETGPNAKEESLKKIPEQVFPKDYQNDIAAERAKTQSEIAQKFFYFMSEDMKKHISGVMKNFVNLFKYMVEKKTYDSLSKKENFNANTPEDDKVELLKQKNEIDHAFATIVGRQMDNSLSYIQTDLGCQDKSKTSEEHKKEINLKKYKKVKEILNKVALGIGDHLDYFASIGILGDIGTFLLDKKARDRKLEFGKEGELIFELFEGYFKKRNQMRTKESKHYMGDNLDDVILKFYCLFNPDNTYDIPNNSNCKEFLTLFSLYNDSKDKRSKQAERLTCANNNNEKKLDKRSGVFDISFDYKNKEKSLGRYSWPWQTVPKKLVDKCPDEPWAGHISGSFYEIVFMQKIFQDKDKTDFKLQNEKQLVVASAFLIAGGYHSAVEVNFMQRRYETMPLLKYLKQIRENKDTEIQKMMTIDEYFESKDCKNATGSLMPKIEKYVDERRLKKDPQLTFDKSVDKEESLQNSSKRKIKK